MTDLYFDADMLVYQSCVVNENPIEWSDGMYTIDCCLEDVISSFNQRVVKLKNLVSNYYQLDKVRVFMALTSTEYNFRKTILPTYKGNRSLKRRPLCLMPMRDYVHKNYTTIEIPHLEADDVIGMYCGDNPNAVMISGDKDFRSIPCRFYDFSRDEYFDTTQDEAVRWHYIQTLVGDSVDGYVGCPTIGYKRAKRILDENCTWQAIVDTYKEQGLTEEHALTQARLAYILRHKEEYNKETGEIKLWKPPTHLQKQ